LGISSQPTQSRIAAQIDKKMIIADFLMIVPLVEIKNKFASI